MVDPLFGGWGG